MDSGNGIGETRFEKKVKIATETSTTLKEDSLWNMAVPCPAAIELYHVPQKVTASPAIPII